MPKYLHFRFSPLFSLLLALSVLLVIPACSGPLGILTGGGPNIAANTQLGKENTQTIGVSTQQKFAPQEVNLTLGEEVVRPQSRPIQTPKVEQVQNQVNNELPTWVWIMLILVGVIGLLTDHPGSYAEKRRLRRRIKELESKL